MAALSVCSYRTAFAQSFAEFSVPTPPSFPTDIVAGPDGALWFTESPTSLGYIAGDQIGRLTLDGVLLEFPVSTVSAEPHGIAVGPDGNLWFTEQGAGKIGRISPSGTITEFALPDPMSRPRFITLGNGALWFTELDANRIGRISTTGVIQEFPLPTSTGGPNAIARGPDGNIWFTEIGTASRGLGRIDPAGNIVEFTIPTEASLPLGITAGADGNLWFTEFDGNRIGRITTNGTITEFPLPPHSDPIDITLGSDGNIWFTERNAIARITPTGQIAEFPIPTLNSGPLGLATGPDGAMWFTEATAEKIGRLSLGPAITPTPPTTNAVPTLSLSSVVLLAIALVTTAILLIHRAAR